MLKAQQSLSKKQNNIIMIATDQGVSVHRLHDKE